MVARDAAPWAGAYANPKEMGELERRAWQQRGPGTIVHVSGAPEDGQRIVRNRVVESNQARHVSVAEWHLLR